MNKFWIIALGVAGVVAAPLTAATSRAGEAVAPVETPQIAWGAAQNDLQLGIRFDDNFRVYRRGETMKFALIARNVGKKAVKFKYRAPLFPVPFVTDETGATRAKFLKSPPPLGYPVSGATLALAPGAQREIEKTEVRIGAPLKQTLFWALDGAPGKYRVGFKVSLQSLADMIAQMNQKSGRAPLELKSGFLALEIAPFAKTVAAPTPAEGAEFAAQLPPGALLKPMPYQWGREVNGLQLGIRLEVPGEPIPATKPVPLGTIVAFSMAVHNVGERAIKIQYSEGIWSQSPSVTDEAGGQLSINAQAALFGAARGGQVFTVTKILAPHEMLEFNRESLAVGVPKGDFSDPVLVVEPGVYRVSYHRILDPANALASGANGLKSLVQFERDKPEPAKPNYKYDLTSGEVWLEVAPAKSDNFN